jgi:signal transduction histidine kinase/CheY-like chemotaxis protein
MNPLRFFADTWRSMGIVRKFAAALGSMLALILFVAAIGFGALEVLEQKVGSIVADSMRMQRLALEVDSRLQLARQAERDFSMRIHDLGVEGARTAYALEFTERVGEARRNVIWLQEMVRFSAGQGDADKSAARLAELRDSIEAYAMHFRRMVDTVIRSGAEHEDLRLMTGELDSDYMQLSSQVRQLAIAATDAARNAREGIALSSRLVKSGMVFCVVFALLLAASIIWVLNRTVARNVIRLTDAATELSLGNLGARAEVTGGAEFRQLGDSLNAMAERMTKLVNDLEGQAAMASDRLVEAIDSISEGFMLFDRRERLVLANRQVWDMAGDHVSSMPNSVSATMLLRSFAESGLFVNALGHEEEWVQERLTRQRNPGPHLEEPLSDGRWLLVKIYRSGRGEVVVLMTDITERKRRDLDMASMNSDLEDLVRQRTRVLVEKAMELKQANRRLMELDELKSAFLSSVSHELRTPLTSLLGFSKIIKRDFLRCFMPMAMEGDQLRLGERIQANLDIIGNEGERLTRLINDVLDLSRIESGKERWRFTEVDLAGAINAAVEASSGLFEAKPEVRLVIRRFDMVPLVHADPDRLQQVLINLLSNACKFTEVGEVCVDLYRDDQDRVHVCVEDTGCGIAPEYLEDIFDKFHQVQQGDTLTRKPAGTGLGLAICRQIVEHYGGSIWAESSRGRGTAVHLRLPVAVPEGKSLVLVVDDDPATRDYLSMVLRKAGFGVRTACDGEQALTMAARHKPDLITMDILMPGMDGRTAIARLREREETASVPVLVVSVVEDCHTAGGDAVLLKPVNGDSFVDAVRALLGESSGCRPVLAVGDPDATLAMGLASLDGERVLRCRPVDLWARLEEGFRGTVLVHNNLAAELDLSRMCSMPDIQVILLPDPLSPESTMASERAS